MNQLLALTVAASLSVLTPALVTAQDIYDQLPRVVVTDNIDADIRVFPNGCSYARATYMARQSGYLHSWHLIINSVGNAVSRRGCNSSYVQVRSVEELKH